MSFQKTIVQGNLGADAELRITSDGRRCLRFTVAVTRRWKTKATQQQQEETTWFQVQEWSDRDSPILAYLKKGREVLVCGRLNQYKYTSRDGREGTAWALIPTEPITLCGGQQRRTAGDATVDDAGEDLTQEELDQLAPAGGATDDDIPF